MSDLIYENPFKQLGIMGTGITRTVNKPGGRIAKGVGMSNLMAEFADKDICTFVNKTGATIGISKSLIPDITAAQGIITVAAAQTWAQGADTALVLSDSLSGEEGIFRLIFTNSVAALDVIAAGITIVGYDYKGNSITEVIASTADASMVKTSINLYKSITSITITSGVNASNATAKLAVTAKAINALCLPAAAADLKTVVGVCVGAVDGMNATAVPDEGYGYFVPLGPIVEAYVDAATSTAGAQLETSGAVAGNLAAGGTAAQSIAKLLDANGAHNAAAQKIWVMLKTADA